MKTKTKKTIKKTKAVKTAAYEAKIKIFGKEYKAIGKTAREAIENLTVKGKVGGICILTISHGETTRSKIVPSTQLQRLFSLSKLMREFALKNTSLLFENL